MNSTMVIPAHPAWAVARALNQMRFYTMNQLIIGATNYNSDECPCMTIVDLYAYHNFMGSTCTMYNIMNK